MRDSSFALFVKSFFVMVPYVLIPVFVMKYNKDFMSLLWPRGNLYKKSVYLFNTCRQYKGLIF